MGTRPKTLNWDSFYTQLALLSLSVNAHKWKKFRKKRHWVSVVLELGHCFQELLLCQMRRKTIEVTTLPEIDERSRLEAELLTDLSWSLAWICEKKIHREEAKEKKRQNPLLCQIFRFFARFWKNQRIFWPLVIQFFTIVFHDSDKIPHL